MHPACRLISPNLKRLQLQPAVVRPFMLRKSAFRPAPAFLDPSPNKTKPQAAPRTQQHAQRIDRPRTRAPKENRDHVRVRLAAHAPPVVVASRARHQDRAA
jgi:hypothetical protein